MLQVLLSEILKEELETVSVGAQRIACSTNGVKILEVTSHWNYKVSRIIHDHISLVVIGSYDFLNAHLFPPHHHHIKKSMRLMEDVGDYFTGLWVASQVCSPKEIFLT